MKYYSHRSLLKKSPIGIGQPYKFDNLEDTVGRYFVDVSFMTGRTHGSIDFYKVLSIHHKLKFGKRLQNIIYCDPGAITLPSNISLEYSPGTDKLIAQLTTWTPEYDFLYSYLLSQDEALIYLCL